MTVLAHSGPPPAPDQLWGTWTLEPAVVAGLAVLAVGYARGWVVLRHGGGRRGRALAFAGALAALTVALVSPLDALGQALFSAHMAQHMVLILVAAPLLVLGVPGLPLALALPPGWRRRLARWRARAVRAARRASTQPLAAWALHVGVLWAWHLPGPYQAALTSPAVHALEHASFLGSAWLFWLLVLGAPPRRTVVGGLATLYVLVTALPSAALGALLTFAPAPLYPDQALGAAAWGLDPLLDQQLAGLVMWVPADLLYVAVAAALFARWLRGLERDSPARPGALPGVERPAALPAAVPRRSR
jgi:cytochrome c oxidase assembly factor CtaG